MQEDHKYSLNKRGSTYDVKEAQQDDQLQERWLFSG